jgi:hypothetical protein
MLTPEQKKARLGKITSSTAAACLGLDPNTSQIDAQCRILGTAEEDDKPEPNQKAIDRGNRLENYILDYGADVLAEELGRPVFRTGAPFRSIAPWIGDSCDALYWPDLKARDGSDYDELLAIGEGKSVNRRVAEDYGDEFSDEIPHHTLIQSHIHLVHWPEVDECLVPVLVGGYKFEFRCYVVKRDKEFEDIILHDLKEWHDRYITGQEIPPARCSDESWLQRRYPEALGGVMPATEEIKQLAFAKWRQSKQETAAHKRVCDLKAKIKKVLGDDCDTILADWGKITWYNNASVFMTDWDKIALELMDKHKVPKDEREKLIEEHTKEKLGPRVLRVSIKKSWHDRANRGEEDNDDRGEDTTGNG